MAGFIDYEHGKDFPDCACLENGGCPFLTRIGLEDTEENFGIANCIIRGEFDYMAELSKTNCHLIPIPLFPLIKAYWKDDEVALITAYETLRGDMYHGDPTRG